MHQVAAVLTYTRYMPNIDGPTYVDAEGIEWWRDGSVWNCWAADQWVPAPGANPTGLVKVDTDAVTPTCGRCREEVLVDALFCGSCGADLHAADDETPEPFSGVQGQEVVITGPMHSPEQAPDPFTWSRKYCSNGHQVETGSSVCGECGVVTSLALRKNPGTRGGRPVSMNGIVAKQKRANALAITLLMVLVLLVGGGIALAAAHSSGSGNLTSASDTSGNTGNTGNGFSPPTSGPTSSQLQQAYQAGYFYGQHLNGPISFCRTSRYTDAQRNAQFQDGCGAAMGGGSSSSNYGGIPGNQGPSPTAAHVQPYSGGSYSGSVDGSSGGFSGAP